MRATSALLAILAVCSAIAAIITIAASALLGSARDLYLTVLCCGSATGALAALTAAIELLRRLIDRRRSTHLSRTGAALPHAQTRRDRRRAKRLGLAVGAWRGAAR